MPIVRVFAALVSERTATVAANGRPRGRFVLTDIAPYPGIAAIGDKFGRLICAHIDHAFRTILRGPCVCTERGFARLITGEPHPFGNFVLVSDAADVAATSAGMAPLLTCGAPTAAIFTGAVSSEVAAVLRSAGFEPAEAMPAMGIEIEKLPATALPAGYSFARYGDGVQGEEWGRAFADGYELPRGVGAQFAPDVGMRVTASDSPLQYFAILKDGKPVCTSMVFLHQGVAGIYGVATLPAERGKGLGAHATAQPLRLAHQLGYRVGVLQASPAGHPVYKRLGFADFGEVPLYVRMPA